jgi:hypothetical protein
MVGAGINDALLIKFGLLPNGHSVKAWECAARGDDNSNELGQSPC